MAQQLANPTSIREDVDLITGIAEWVKDLALSHCSNLGCCCGVCSIPGLAQWVKDPTLP